MFVVTVEFEIAAQMHETFLVEMVRNAETSRACEPGCRQFDVCVDPTRPGRVVLYELYDDKTAFDVHCRSAHFMAFEKATASMVVSKKVDILERLSP